MTEPRCRRIPIFNFIFLFFSAFPHGSSLVQEVQYPDGVRIIADDVVAEEPLFTCHGRQDGVYPDYTSNCTLYHRCIMGSTLTFRCDDGFSYDTSTGDCVTSGACLKDRKENAFAATCQGKSDGVYIDYESHCHNYYRCQSGMKIDFTCGQHMVFELRSASCVDSNLSQCHVPTCQGKEKGYYSLPDSDSEFYYQCDDNQSPVSIFTCPRGQQFDSMLATCQTFPFTSLVQPNCSEKADGFYPDVTSSCRNVYYCQSQQVVSLLSCSSGFSFDANVNHCREEHLVSCAPSTPPVASSASDCQSKADGYYPEFASACQSFYYCFGGEKLFNVSCPEGKLFNNVLEKCDDAANVVCSAMTLPALQHFCFGKSNGFYPNPVTGCKSYVFCQAGRVTSEVTCPKGKVFNVTIEDCASAGSGTKGDNLCARMLVEDCFGKSDGYHPYYSYGCEKYFYCGGERKLLEFQCPTGQLFHPVKKQCMNASRVTCEQQGFSPECTARVDGYYPNPASDCRSFYYCRNGRKMNELSCPANQVFDMNAQACTDDDQNTYCHSTPVCTSNGLHGDIANSCHSYYFCHQGRKTRTFDCSVGKVFDATSRACVIEALAKCQPAWSNESSQCTNKSDGFHSFSNDGSHLFFHCLGGEITSNFECPPGANFDDNLGRCVPKNDTHHCHNGFCCRGLPDAFYAVNDLLVKDVFYSCFHEQLTVHQCPKGLVFNWKTVSCDNPNPFEPIPSSNCTERMDGFTPTLLANEIRVFSVCVNETSVTTGVCWWGQAFSHVKGTCVSIENLRHSLNKTDCSCGNHSDGYYVNIKSGGFTTYCLCHNKTCLDHFQCSNTLVFDESSEKCKSLSHKASSSKPTLPPRTSTEPVSVVPAVPSLKTQLKLREVLKRVPISNRHPSTSTVFPTESLNAQPYVSVVPQSVTAEIPKPKSYPSPISSNKYLVGDSSCQGKMNEVFADVTSGCRQFYICFREVKMLFTCSEGRLFNPVTKTCDDPKDVICQQTKSTSMDSPTNDIQRTGEEERHGFHRPEGENGFMGKFACLPYETGFFPEYSSGCRDFYVCFRGIQKTYSCPDGLLFSPVTKSCDAPANVNCTPTEESGDSISPLFYMVRARMSHPTADCGPDGLVAVRNECRKYIVCKNGVQEVRSCPSPMRYSTRSRKCELAARVRCNVSGDEGATTGSARGDVTTTWTPPSTTTVVSETSTVAPPFDCSQKVDGFYADYSRKCHVFYRCLRGRKLSYYCKVGQLFNPKSQICDFEENVVCNGSH